MFNNYFAGSANNQYSSDLDKKPIFNKPRKFQSNKKPQKSNSITKSPKKHDDNIYHDKVLVAPKHLSNKKPILKTPLESKKALNNLQTNCGNKWEAIASKMRSIESNLELMGQ